MRILLTIVLACSLTACHLPWRRLSPSLREHDRNLTPQVVLTRAELDQAWRDYYARPDTW